MIFKRLHIVIAVSVILVGSTGAFAVRKFKKDPATQSGTRVDSIAAAPVADSSSGSNTDVFIPVEAADVVQDTLILAVSAAGQAEPWREASITAQVAGQVQGVNRTENGSVSAGSMLASIDPAEYKLALDEAQARKRSAEATYRETTLFDERITDANLKAERQKAARAKSGLDQAEVAVAKAQLELARATVKSPFSGRVADLTVQTGQYVRPGDKLMTIVDLSRIKVDVNVLEGQVSYLTAGRKAKVHFAAFPDEEFEGRIETINPMVDKETRSARVVVSVANPEGRILPGMYARVSLDARRFADKILVPREAILERDRRKLLFVFEPNEEGGTRGLAKWRYVTTGLENESQVEIVETSETETVRPGEKVLTAGHQTLVHDARVRVTEKSDTVSNARPRF
jgi:RND family efflux transporter MFP subunit